MIVLHPLGGEYPERRPISISINASDPDGIAYAIAEITLPNGSKENLTLGEGLGSDDFDFDTMGINWTEESYKIGPSQSCIANIDGTIPGKAYTSLVGDGTPETDTFCTIISEKALDGDFDIWIDFNIEEEAGVDYAANFQITRVQSSAGAIRMIFIALSNWTGLGRNYEIFADDGNFSDYILSRPTDDTSGKMRIKREGNNFTFYTWNNSAADWNEEEVDRNEFDFARGVYVSFESESAYPGWGNISVGWDNFTVQGSGSMFGMFNNTFELGPYNVSFHVGDHVGGVNDSERTNFTIAHLNTPPSKPYLLAPFPGEAVGGPYNITWSEVNDYDDDSVQFNITLLNPDGSDNATLVSTYGNITSTTYGWDTHLFEDGLYSMRISVFENETAELLGNEYTMLGNFTINNNALSINNISAAPDPSGYWFNITITANVTGANLVLVGITPPGGAESNHTMVSSTPGIYEYVYSTWANGTYIYTIYATDIFSHAQNASGNFSVYQNLSIQVRTTQDYYPANTQINITDPPGPSIISAHVLPEKVIPGDTMRISVTVYDHAGVRSVTAYMPHDLGEDEVPFSLVNGTETYGVWEADWLVHDTSPREYFSTIVAENTLGQRSEKEVRWFDPPGAWILPNGDYDPTGQWTTRADARDGNTDTYSSDNSNPGGGWGTYIYLNTTMIDSEKVRVWADYGPEVNAVDIDVYNGTWVDAYQGPISNLAWFEANFSRTNITEGRFRFNYSVGGWIYWLYEFQFYNITVTVTKPAAVTQAAISIEETSAILHGLITNDGGSDCQVRFVYGNDTSFQNSTMWYSPRYTGDQLNVRLTGLENGRAYYYLIQVNNSAGLSNGSILSFTTGPAPVGWVSPTGYDDPAGRWEQEEYAFDDSLITSAQSYHVSGDPNGVWSSYLYLNRSPAVISSRVRFNAKSVDIDRASIDIYNGTAWINVFNSSFAGQTWVSAYFNQTNVSQARIQFRVDSNSKGLYWRLYEFDFYKDSMTPYPNQSLLSNMGNPGNTNASCLLFMKTQFWNGSGWLDDDIVVNESTPRVLEPLDVIKLDSIWNPLNYSTNNLSFGDGTYRVYAACLDNESNVLMNLGGDYVNSSHNFTYDTTPPLVIIVSPPNGSDWNLTNTIPIWVNVTDMLGISSVQANVSNAIGSEIVVLAHNSTSGYWEYPYSNTNYPGLYTIRIIATGLAGNVNDTEFVQVNVNDVIPPTVILAAPPDNHTYNTTTSLPVNFTCNATDDFNLNNISLYITDSTNSSFSLNATQPVSGAQASATFQLDLAPGTYTWNCDAYDSSGNRGWGESNRTLFIQRAITNCAYLSIPGSNYSLSADLFANKTDSICITIDAPGITLDCAGFSITGAGGNTSGIAIINSSGVRIENCIVSNYSSAFLLQNANDSYLRNNTGFNSEYGFYVDPSYNNTIIENQAFNNSIDGLKLEYSHNNSIINNSAYNNSNNGIYLYWSDENALRGNTAHENSGMGLFLQSSSGNNLTVNAAYGNGEGFFLDVSSGNSLVGNSAYS
ncbi:MAG TPA: NosD domain-containing protein, partial [Candidatus Bilamarchaeaceae archaeon]|nr:NosD domain-containing protein [Candidatus Bilamarchaeaceae archaeon]